MLNVLRSLRQLIRCGLAHCEQLWSFVTLIHLKLFSRTTCQRKNSSTALSYHLQVRIGCCTKWNRERGGCSLFSPEKGEEDSSLFLQISKLVSNGNINNDYIFGSAGKSLTIVNGKRWQQMRKLLTPAFHADVLKPYVKLFHESTNTLLVSQSLQINFPFREMREVGLEGQGGGLGW